MLKRLIERRLPSDGLGKQLWDRLNSSIICLCILALMVAISCLILLILYIFRGAHDRRRERWF